MNKMGEIRVYGVDYVNARLDVDYVNYDINNGDFIDIAEAQGHVWTLEGFQHDYNIDDISSNIVIRII
jgi:hypothetical protein